MRPESAIRETTELNCMKWTLLYNYTCVSLHSSYLLLPSAHVCAGVCVCARVRLSCFLWENGCLKPSDRCRALQACHQSWLFIRGCRSPAGRPRQAPQLEYMHKLNRHPNSLPYTKQFKWYSLERWQVLMSLSLWQRGEGESHEETESGDGQLLFFFFLFFFSTSAFCQLCSAGTQAWGRINALSLK